jgi:F-type H+-transporting ATPase subunit gamma
MSETLAGIQKKIDGAGELQTVVRTMKALAASSIGQYERSVLALADYCRSVELGLGACLRLTTPVPDVKISRRREVGAIVFGSDQGLVGQFNDRVADLAIQSLSVVKEAPHVWVVGERVGDRIRGAGLPIGRVFGVAASVNAIVGLVGQIQIEMEAAMYQSDFDSIHLFYNRPLTGALYEPIAQRLLPLDREWRNDLTLIAWPKPLSPQIIGGSAETLRALIREFLFISLFRACTESLASENASRLAAMQRAEKNIEGLLGTLQGKFHRIRQAGIDEELFDITSGFESLSPRRHQK